MNTIKSMRIDREDITDAAVFAALGAIVILSLEFLFTASTLHYISTAIFIVEAAAAAAAGVLISIVALKATPDD